MVKGYPKLKPLAIRELKIVYFIKEDYEIG